MKKIEDYTKDFLTGKNILITGGTTGIGRATAELLSMYGARVFIFGRDAGDLANALEEIREAVPDCVLHGMTADVSLEEEVSAVFSTFSQKLGSIDILVNNAAVPAETLSGTALSDIRYTVESNLTGYLYCAHEAANRMKQRGAGHIVNIGSMSAEVQEASGTVYVATKAGIRGFSGALRKELDQSGIRVSLIEPGAVKSDMQPGSDREKNEKIANMEMLEAADIARAVVFCLCQPKRCEVVSMQVRPHLQLI